MLFQTIAVSMQSLNATQQHAAASELFTINQQHVFDCLDASERLRVVAALRAMSDSALRPNFMIFSKSQLFVFAYISITIVK
jgi:hypothetical protein